MIHSRQQERVGRETADLHYQLALLTPGNNPFEASSRNAILDNRGNRYTPRPRPVRMHLFLVRVIDPLRDRLESL